MQNARAFAVKAPEPPATLSANTAMSLAAKSMATNVPPTAPSLCGLQASVSGTDPTGVSDFVAETDQATATRSGSAATCSVVIPYLWTLSVPTFDNVTLSGSATAVDTTGNGRTSSFQLETIALPATGTVTTVTYSGKL